MEALLSSIASSTLISIIRAPFSTCCRATSSAASKSPFKISFLNLAEPVTFVRSPTLIMRACCRITTPEKRLQGRLNENYAWVLLFGVAAHLLPHQQWLLYAPAWCHSSHRQY